MKRSVVIFFGVLAILGTAVWAMVKYEHGFAHGLGVDTQASQFYDFVSGSGPMFIALIGYSGLFAGLWHSLNCHEPGCLLIGRHKVNGTPWCNLHHENARTERTEYEVLVSIEEKLGDLVQLLSVSAGNRVQTADGQLAERQAQELANYMSTRYGKPESDEQAP